MTHLQGFYDWIGNSPSLFKEAPPFVSFSSLVTTAKAPSDYQGNPRLGFVYQYLCAHRLTSSPCYRVELEEVQINDQQGQTLGAIDLILHNHASKHYEHWEVAIKFYLLHQGVWYGPNAQDQLDKKLSRMLKHQLKMSSSPEFLAMYPNLHTLSEHVLIQGRLYINPFEAEPIPENCLGFPLNPSQINGYWCYKSQWQAIEPALYELDKQDWAAGLGDFQRPLTKLEGKFVHAQTRAGQFWFIVEDDWPM